jgi:guanylate kinase
VPKSARLFVISGPSGVGKDTLAGEVLNRLSGCERVVTATTRQPRPGEIDGTSYRFLSDEDFDRMVGEDGFLEWAVVHGNRYGTPKEFVLRKLSEGTSLLLAIDIQGAKTIREKMREAVTIFIAPPSFKELERRLRGRSTESDAEVETRIKAAEEEMRQMDLYDFAVVNQSVRQASDELLQIIKSESGRSLKEKS